MIEIMWLVDTENIPGYGIAYTGKSISLPKDLAANFVSQGKAKYPRSKTTTKEEG